ncbi:MAG TPA: penicillin-binding transpeptidase domain-containing protein, partial [Patescibacteria group bacterium]|nr:penicillin-binding transpeptidase domain-containing protein [Patescibacteria group bacterium]
MIKKYFKDRLDIFRAVTALIFLVLVFRLADLQIVKGEYYRQKSETIRTRNISVTAPRGNIVDKYGRLIAGSKQSYSVNIMKADVSQETLNDIAISAINIIVQNGDTYKDEIPILINPVMFTFQKDELDWKRKYEISDDATAKDAFLKLRSDYGISEDIIDAEAYEVLKEQNVELPFDIMNFQFDFKKSEIKWKESNGFKEEDTAAEVFEQLCSKYNIPRDKYDDDKAKKILAVKYLLGQNKYRAYEPVEIAANIKYETRAKIEENKVFLSGVEIMQKPLRHYPNNDFTSHIVGYMGKIGDELEELSAQGYTPQDMIGKSGIEHSMEKYLKGQNGSKQIEVDVKGTLIDTINEVDPTPGDTVFLTIDSRLQKIAEDSLRNTMEEIRSGKGKDKAYTNATSGAVVALDVNTGEVLAMASEPKFDPNLFSVGINNEDWRMLQPTSKDIYAPKPLINNAISATLPPGSTMKMLTGIAGLESNVITPSEIIVDKGIYTAIPGASPASPLWRNRGMTQGPQDIGLAIRNSNNYYFYEVGRRIGGETFEKFAVKFGFGQKTGIELPYESVGSVEGPEHKKALYKRYLSSYLTNTLKLEDESIRKEIISFIDSKPESKQIGERLKEFGITDSKAVVRVVRYVNDSRYRPGEVLNAAIGQGMNDVTPLQLVNYVAIIA